MFFVKYYWYKTDLFPYFVGLKVYGLATAVRKLELIVLLLIKILFNLPHTTFVWIRKGTEIGLDLSDNFANERD